MSFSLNGADGLNRAPAERCQIHARHDYEAIQCWLERYKNKSSTTYRLYQKEAERLLLWCIFQRNIPLSSLKEAELTQYLEFLSDPQPAHLWCGKSGGKGHKRGMPGWKPFVKGLSISAKRTAYAALDSLFTFLVDARYLDFHPLSLMRCVFNRPKSLEERQRDIKERSLEPKIWNSLIATLEAWPAPTLQEQNDKERLRWLIHILYFLGLRNGDLSLHTFAAFEQDEEGKWWFAAFGKGDKFKPIPVHNELVTAMKRFRAWFKLSELPLPYEKTPLIPSWKGQNGLHSRQINNILKKLSKETAKKFTHSPSIAERLNKFSAHWIRHQSASMQDFYEIKKDHIRKNLGHSSEQTTDLYIHHLKDIQHADIQKLQILYEFE